MSVLFFLVIASILAIVVGRVGTVLFQKTEFDHIQEMNMSIILFPVVASALAIVVGRVGTIMLQHQDESK